MEYLASILSTGIVGVTRVVPFVCREIHAPLHAGEHVLFRAA